MIANYPEDLRRHAITLLQPSSTEADLRRSISANYYAVFHLLIRDALALWGEPEHHEKLSGIFDHKRMKVVSEAVTGTFEAALRRKQPVDPATEQLRNVAFYFVTLQQARHEADYNTTQHIQHADATTADSMAENAFTNWMLVRQELIARDYLYSFLFKDRS